MARIRLDCTGIENLARKLGSLGDAAAGAVQEMLEKGASMMVDGLQRGVQEYGHVRDGDLQKSIGIKDNSLKADPDGGSVVITFKGTDERGERYGAIAYYLNYGTSSIQADHWIDNTVELMRPLCNEAMEQVLNKHINAHKEA